MPKLSPLIQEEGGYEYIFDHQDAESGEQEAHLESGVLYQPLGETSIEGSESEQLGHGGHT
jgi:hypothetical protein